MDGGRNLLHIRAVPKIAAKPGDRRIDLLRGARLHDGLGLTVRATQREQRQIDNGAVETELAKRVSIVEVRFQRTFEFHNLAALGLRKTTLEKARVRNRLQELPGYGSTMDNDD
jgi:hypothetical protein